MLKLQQESSKKTKSQIKEEIKGLDLPPMQEENIFSCLEAAQVTNKHATRYTAEWVYQCLLLKIKSSSAYHYLRRHNIMALPSPSTLYRLVFSPNVHV